MSESQLSYARGPALVLSDKTTPQVLADTVARFPDREALVVCHQKIRLTWRQLSEDVERTARGLIGLGLAPGDRVGVWATNCAEWIYLQLGCAHVGARVTRRRVDGRVDLDPGLIREVPPREEVPSDRPALERVPLAMEIDKACNSVGLALLR